MLTFDLHLLRAQFHVMIMNSNMKMVMEFDV